MPTEAETLLEAAHADLSRGFTLRAGTRLRQAAAAGSREALVEFAQALLRGRISGRHTEARHGLEQAGGDLPPLGYMVRGALRYAGVGGERDSEGALTDLGRAAACGLSAAYTETALAWLEWGGAEAVGAARAWLALAARQEEAVVARAVLAQLAPPGGPEEPAPLRGWAPLPMPAREMLNDDPRIELFPRTLSPAECAWLCAAAQARLAPSRIIDPQKGGSRRDSIRTGACMFFDPGAGSIFALRVAARLATLAGRDPACAEALAVLRYQPGQEYKPHYDWLDPDTLARDPLSRAGNRIATVIAYLHEPDSGGATVFPRLNLQATPRAGNALHFANCTADGELSRLVLHAGEPVEGGEKWLASLWIRAHPIALP